MKKSALILSIFLVSVAATAQQVFDKWPEMMHFEVALSQIAYASEEGNFEPVRSRAKELVEKATEMAASAEKGAVLDTSKELRQQTVSLFEATSNPNAKEAEIAGQLEKVEQIFDRLSGLTKSPNKMYTGR